MNNTTSVAKAWVLNLVILALLIGGLASSVYLQHLHMEVHDPSGQPVDSFCAINEGFNCIKVANSKYSVILGVPLSMLGIEFFALATLFTILYMFGLRSLRQWPSLLFLLCTLGLIPSLILAMISMYEIKSFCIMCCSVYVVFFLVALILGIANRKTLTTFFFVGVKDMMIQLKNSKKYGISLLFLAFFGLGQFVYLPACVNPKPKPTPESKMTQTEHNLPYRDQELGRADAPILIKEFTDYECPFCGRAHAVMLEFIARHPEHIRMRHHDYPLDDACNPAINSPFHPNACRSAVYAKCASFQGKYLPYEKLLFQNRTMHEEKHQLEYAKQVGLDLDELKECVADPGTMQLIQKDIQAAINMGMRGTPTFIIDDEAVVGLRPLEFWEQWLKEKLNPTKTAEEKNEDDVSPSKEVKETPENVPSQPEATEKVVPSPDEAPEKTP